MTFEDELKSLVFFHLEKHTAAQHLLQVLEEDDFARDNIAPKEGIKKSSFTEAINTRGLEQFAYVFQKLQDQTCKTLGGNFLDWITKYNWQRPNEGINMQTLIQKLYKRLKNYKNSLPVVIEKNSRLIFCQNLFLTCIWLIK